MTRSVFASFVLVCFIALAPLQATTVFGGATVISPGTTFDYSDAAHGGPYTIGWSFHVVNPITINTLGYFQANASLAENHDVALFACVEAACTTPTAALATATVTNADLLDGSFRWASIATTVLAPGDYLVAGFGGSLPSASGDPYIYFGSGANVTFDPNILFGIGKYVAGATLAFPSTSNPNASSFSYFGPNIGFETPEPATVGLMAAGLFAFAGFARRRR